MRKYEKPVISVMDLQLREDIAAIPTTVYKGKSSSYSNAALVHMALTNDATGLAKDGIIVVS